MAANRQLEKDLRRIEGVLLENAEKANILTNITYGDDGWESIIISAVNPNCPVNKPAVPAGIEEHYQ